MDNMMENELFADNYNYARKLGYGTKEAWELAQLELEKLKNNEKLLDLEKYKKIRIPILGKLDKNTRIRVK